MEDENSMRAVISAAREATTPTMYEDGRVAFVPGVDGNRPARLMSMEPFAAQPFRKRGTVVVFDAASLNQIIKDNNGPNVAIYIDRNPNAPVIEAVLNGVGPAGPGWGDHRVKIEFRPTPQWAKWKAIDGKLMDQTSFAEFIEDNQTDVQAPSGAQMLEIATYFQATRTTEFKKAIRLSSGDVQFVNVENTNAQVGSGQIAVPETITLGLAPIQGSPLYAVPARFRFRLEDGKLRLGIKLERIEDLMEKVLEDVIAKIERATNISVLDGRAPAAITAMGG
ncbi:MAG: YfdQ family protein [Roseomonas sp.]|nr:YfdQ family protein [Roseomonas sp.]